MATIGDFSYGFAGNPYTQYQQPYYQPPVAQPPYAAPRTAQPKIVGPSVSQTPQAQFPETAYPRTAPPQRVTPLPTQVGTTTAAAGVNKAWNTDGYAMPQYTVTPRSGPMPGWDRAKWGNVNHQTPKYVVGRILSQFSPRTTNMDAVVAAIQKAYPGARRVGSGDVSIPGVGIIDILTNADVGGKAWHWGTSSSGGGGGKKPTTPMPGTTGGSAIGSISALGRGGSAPAWAPTATPYVPGEIGMGDIPNVSFEQLLALASQGSKLEPQIEASIANLLKNPSAMSEQVVGEMKARTKDELAAQGRMADVEARNLANQYGIAQSPWYASEQQAATRARNAAAVQGYRDIDIRAAETRKADERAAAELGMQYGSEKAQRRQAAVFGAHSAALQAAAVRGDRMQLREQTKQMATQLGISQDEARLRYIIAQMDDLTRRYGIDVGAQVDMARLKEQGKEAQENLMFQYAQLAQQNEQFGASYGLEAAQLQRGYESDRWRQLMDMYG